MSDMTTIARPYAKAIFEHARDTKKLPEWSCILHDLSQAVLDPVAQRLLTNPASHAEMQSQLLLAVFAGRFKDLQESINNLIVLLAENKRLMLLPDVCAQYESLRAEQEKTLTVQVRSFSNLTADQQQQLTQSLSQRLQRQITLDVNIDQSLLGGAVIYAGDMVIDGSVRGKLNKLRINLAA